MKKIAKDFSFTHHLSFPFLSLPSDREGVERVFARFVQGEEGQAPFVKKQTTHNNKCLLIYSRC